MEVTFGGKYRLEEEIANGGCGSVFLGVHTIAGKEVAIKLEPAIPRSLTSPLRQESKAIVNVIDFGLARRFRDSRTGEHLPTKRKESTVLNAHRGVECARRDDLESLAYMLIYFLRGTLPWRKLRAPTVSQKWDLILQAKLDAIGPLLPQSSPDLVYREQLEKEEQLLRNDAPSLQDNLEHEETHSIVEKSRPFPSIAPPLQFLPNPPHLLQYVTAITVENPLLFYHSDAHQDPAYLPPPTIPMTATLPVEFTLFLTHSLSLSFTDLPDYDGLHDMFRNLGCLKGTVASTRANEISL
ncbi:kinase-like domain-containing protein [Chiua virens]|nr:kinase-like domain-containing protein [Chiua virens]